MTDYSRTGEAIFLNLASHSVQQPTLQKNEILEQPFIPVDALLHKAQKVTPY